MRKQVLVHALQKFSSSDGRVPKMLDHCEAPEESKQRIPVRKMWLTSLYPSWKYLNEMTIGAISNPLPFKTSISLALPEQ